MGSRRGGLVNEANGRSGTARMRGPLFMGGNVQCCCLVWVRIRHGANGELRLFGVT